MTITIRPLTIDFLARGGLLRRGSVGYWTQATTKKRSIDSATGDDSAREQEIGRRPTSICRIVPSGVTARDRDTLDQSRDDPCLDGNSTAEFGRQVLQRMKLCGHRVAYEIRRVCHTSWRILDARFRAREQRRHRFGCR
jgi:hypothetical protein